MPAARGRKTERDESDREDDSRERNKKEARGMQVTDVRVRVIDDGGKEKLRGFATITLDDEFVVRDLKIIEGNQGLFVAMPSRKMTDRCPRCRTKNAVRSKYCSECGNALKEPTPPMENGRPKLHVDVAHPVTQPCRDRIHQAVISAYEAAFATSPSGADDADDY
jgi:stage V sporulation protein G